MEIRTVTDTADVVAASDLFDYQVRHGWAERFVGIGRDLVTALADLARGRGCYGMWVLTDHDNGAAQATYRAGGAAVEGQPQTMLSWTFERD